MKLNSQFQPRRQQAFRQVGLPHKSDQELMNLPGNVFVGPYYVSDLTRIGGQVVKLRHAILGAVQQAPVSRGDRGDGIIREGRSRLSTEWTGSPGVAKGMLLTTSRTLSK